MKKYFILFALIIIHGCSSGGEESTVAGLPITCGDSSNIYVRTDGSDTNPGTIAQPLLTIQAAVGCGQPGQTVRVANGTYESGSVHLFEGISIYGGYSSDFQVRSPSIYPAIINDVTDMSLNSSESSFVVMTDAGATPATVLDGFTINGTTVGFGGATVTGVSVSGSPTISNNIINGGGNSSNDQSHGIILEFSANNPIIKNNTINGGIASGGSWGIRSFAVGPVTISNNTINGGSSGVSSYAVDLRLLSSGGSTIINNSINGGSGESYSYGIYFDAAAPVTIEANTITGGDGGLVYSTSYGISTKSGAPIIRNNTIILEGATSYGVYNVSNSVISNNTIVGGGSSDSWGIYTKLATSAIFQNNIIDIMGGTCVAEDDTNSDPAILKNNNLTGCVSLYYDEGTTNIASIIAVNALSITDASDNVSASSNLDVTKDYQLTMGSPAVVTQGGLDLSSDFNSDKAGNSRTVPWSIGAYEYD